GEARHRPKGNSQRIDKSAGEAGEWHSGAAKEGAGQKRKPGEDGGGRRQLSAKAACFPGVSPGPKTKQATHCASPVFRPLSNRVAISADWLRAGATAFLRSSSLSPFFW